MPLNDEMPEKIEFDKPPQAKDFWIIYAHATDWQIVISQFLLDRDPSHGKVPMDPKIAFVGLMAGVGVPIYYLAREHFPVETISRLLGVAPERLNGIEELHLREVKGADGKPAQAAWPKPSVDYWGRA